MEIFFIITLVLALIITSAIMAGKNKAEAIKYEKEIIKEPKNNTSRNMALTIIAIGVTIITLIMISKEYKEYQQEQQILQAFYGTTDTDKIEKINKKFEQDIDNGIKMLDKANQKFEQDMKKINEKFKR